MRKSGIHRLGLALVFIGLGLPPGALLIAGTHEMANTDCQPPLLIRRDSSPWRDFTGDYTQEQAGFHVKAVAKLEGFEVPPHLQPGKPGEPVLLAIDRRQQRVVINAKVFSDLDRPDATNLQAGQTRQIGYLKNPQLAGGYAAAARFLVRAELVRSYAHLEASLCLSAEHDDARSYRATFSGTHRYCTNRCTDAPLHFTLRIDKQDGAIHVEGPPAT